LIDYSITVLVDFTKDALVQALAVSMQNPMFKDLFNSANPGVLESLLNTVKMPSLDDLNNPLTKVFVKSDMDALIALALAAIENGTLSEDMLKN